MGTRQAFSRFILCLFPLSSSSSSSSSSSLLLVLVIAMSLLTSSMRVLALRSTSLSSSSFSSSSRMKSMLMRSSSTTVLLRGCFRPTSSSSSSSSFSSRRYMSNLPNEDLEDYENEYNDLGDGLYHRKGPVISWYPGHIAKAERELSEYLKKVDVIIEVRDCRIPFATTHPSVPSWVGGKPLIIAVARIDQVSKRSLSNWKDYYAHNPAHVQRPDAKVFFIDGKLGQGIFGLRKEVLKAGVVANERRARRGINPRATRCAIIGFPNVGKSALINKLLGKTMAKSRNLPGVTRQLMWVRLGKLAADEQESAIEMLDSPGIIPARNEDQEGATRLAICNDIGEASYDRVVVAQEMCERINHIYKQYSGYIDMDKIRNRYKMPDFNKMTGEEIVDRLAQTIYKGNTISAADKLLGDFRKGYMGGGSLEAPPSITQSKGNSNDKGWDIKDVVVDDANEMIGAQNSGDGLDVGKGNYDGW